MNNGEMIPLNEDGNKPLHSVSRHMSSRPRTDSAVNMRVKKTCDDEYGSLNYQNVAKLRLGRFEFNTWYGNSALFTKPMHNKADNTIGTKLAFKDNNTNVKLLHTPKPFTGDSSIKVFEVKDKQPWLDVLYVCPYCFKFTDIQNEWEHHLNCCKFKSNLPGKVMYNDGALVIRKVKGVDHRLFCQCMSLMAKFFLDNKSIFYDLDYFDFYVAYQLLDRHEVPMGFYSRELLSWESNNLSCICVLPCYQNRGLGTKLIDFSYKLSQYEQQISGPERPFSPLGKFTYLRYWCRCLALSFVYGSLSTRHHVTLQMISETIGFRVEDILFALSFLDALYDNGMKNAKMDYYLEKYKYSDHYVFVHDEKYKVYIDKIKIKKWIIENKIPNSTILNPNCFVFY